MSKEHIVVEPQQLQSLHRKKDRAGDRALLNDILDQGMIGVVSTVLDGMPWSIPMFIVREGDAILLHGSTGAGALGHISRGAPVAVAVTIIDGLVIAERQFNHSANYRSAVVRGTCTQVDDDELARALDAFTDALIPGRSSECPPHTAKELAQTILLKLPITEDNWITKTRSGPALQSETSWSAVIPMHQTFDEPIYQSDAPMPLSVQRLLEKHTQ